MSNKRKYAETHTDTVKASPDPLAEKQALLDTITTSFDYNTLDYKWAVRDYLYRHNITSIEAAVDITQHEVQDIDDDTGTDDTFHMMLVSLARSSFDYFHKHYDVITSDHSLRAITQLCSTEALVFHVTETDDEVFHLSRIFNQIIESTRRLHKCYDCGTNARAIFMKLIETHRGKPYISYSEQARMKKEYRVNHKTVLTAIEKCYKTMRDATKDSVYIMSMGIQDFGHVVIIEKRFIRDIHAPDTVAPVARYHHYQSSFKSHLVIDFIEKKNYGQDLQQSLDIDRFFGDFMGLMGKTTRWSDEDTRLFCDLFAFKPVYPVVDPKPGFCFTYVIY